MEVLRRASLVLFVSAILLLAVLMGGIRLVVSNIEHFKPEIGYLLERDVSEGIVFNRVSGSMRGFNPILRIENVSLNLPDRSQPLFIDRLEVEFDFWSSLRERAPVPLKISGRLEKIELTRAPSGQWFMNEYAIGAGADDTALPGFSQLLSWLPRYLKLDLRRLIIHDQKNDTVHQLNRIAARIIHRKDRFFSQVSAALPESLGRGLLLKSIVDTESSLVYVNTSDLRLNPLARLFDVDTLGLKSGALDGEAWIDMTGYRITGISGNLVLKQGVFQVAADKRPLSIDYHGRFYVDSSDVGWRISNQVDRLAIDGDKVPGFKAQVNVPGGASSERLSASIDRLPLSSLPVVARQWLPNPLSDQIVQGRLQGLLQNLLFEMNFEQPELFRFSARATDLSSDRLGRIPGVTNLNADLVIGNNKLSAAVHGEDVSLDFGDLFRAPLQSDYLEMTATLNRQTSGNLLLALDDVHLRNQDVRAVGRVRLEADGENAPFMYLRADFAEANASNTSKYLPVQLMPEKTVEWLDRGIISGFVPAGDLQFHGRLQDLRKLARERAGEFFVDFAIEDANIFFAPGWLNAENARGRVLFRNVGLEFDIEQASYDRLDSVKVRGGIGNFANASLQLAITTEAPTGDAMRVWSNTPVGKRFRDVLSNLQDIDGTVGAAVDLSLPLGREADPNQVKVEIDFKNAALRAPAWGLALSQITGRMRISDDDIKASNVSARFFGDPVSIDISSDDMAINTRVNVNGTIESANLLRRLPSYLGEQMSGSSDWQLRLDIAGDEAPADAPILHLRASSDLRQTRIDLPLPFTKPASTTMEFVTDVDFFAQRIHFRSRMGQLLQGRGTLRVDSEREFRLGALDVAFATSLREQQGPGINLYGSIEEVSLDDWRRVLAAAGGDNTESLESVTLQVDHLQAYRRQLDSVVFEMRKSGQKLSGNIDASLIKGSFEYPLKPSARDPVLINLGYLNVEKTEHEDDFGELKPSHLLPVRLIGKSLHYHDMLFNDLFIAAQPTQQGYEVTEFSMRRDALLLAGKADWKYDPAKAGHLSSIDLTIKGPGLGEAIAELGFGNSMSSGTLDFSGSFKWPAPLPAFSLEQVRGRASLNITDGVMNNVEPGNGRFIGLLSLSALPRRLSLDFSDVLIEGMEFDEISGSYKIAHGVLHTTDTRMDGPAAKIKISGKTGIIRRDYDQHIRVTPNIRQTLPLIGAVSAGTGVGWGLLLLQNLFKKVIDDAVEIEYRVTGSWDDPQIELLKAVDENQQELPKIDK